MFTYFRKHKPRKENTVADALSCLPQDMDVTSLVLLQPFLMFLLHTEICISLIRPSPRLLVIAKKDKVLRHFHSTGWISFSRSPIMYFFFSITIPTYLSNPLWWTWGTSWSFQDTATSQREVLLPTMRHETNQFICQSYTCQITKSRHTNVSLYPFADTNAPLNDSLVLIWHLRMIMPFWWGLICFLRWLILYFVRSIWCLEIATLFVQPVYTDWTPRQRSGLEGLRGGRNWSQKFGSESLMEGREWGHEWLWSVESFKSLSPFFMSGTSYLLRSATNL